ncbi:MAG: hypothetical protein HDT09_00930 [Bacteroidales bacterium]|nr:hypothetical protein [Bacteroidales bacterium]
MASPTPNNGIKNLLIYGGGAVVILLIAWLVYSTVSANRKAAAVQAQFEQVQLEQAQKDLEREYDDLNAEFAQFENSRKFIVDDSVKRELNDKYEAARLQVEKLQQELANQKHKSAAEISRLRTEINTLRDLLKHYVEEIDRLNKENAQLRDENATIKKQNEQLSSKVETATRDNKKLTERMTLAEKLNVTGLHLSALNKKGKNEKKVAKAVQLMVTFTIPQNNSTPVGEKTIYLRIISPSGQLLGGGSTFSFEGGNVPFTARKTIEYEGEEIGGVTIYYDVDTALSPGEYTVELFADNFRLISRKFSLK